MGDNSSELMQAWQEMGIFWRDYASDQGERLLQAWAGALEESGPRACGMDRKDWLKQLGEDDLQELLSTVMHKDDLAKLTEFQQACVESKRKKKVS